MQIQLAGYRLRSPGWDDDGADNPPILIELTAKRWKGLMLIAYALAFMSFFLFSWQLWSGVYQPLWEAGLKPGISPLLMMSETMSSFGGIVGQLFLISAIIVGGYARFMAWWRHG